MYVTMHEIPYFYYDATSWECFRLAAKQLLFVRYALEEVNRVNSITDPQSLPPEAYER